MTFSDLGLDPRLLSALERLHHTAPTAVQAQAIPAALEGHDLIVTSHTGSGKTGAFLLPALQKILEKKGQTFGASILVLTPTRELAQQIERAARDYTFSAREVGTVSVIGGESFGFQQRRLRAGVDLIIATPGRLLDHMNGQRLDLSSVEFLVLDEADRMLDMGFSDDILRIADQLPADRQTMLFSATMDGKVAHMIQKLVRDPRKIEVSTEVDASKLSQIVHLADSLEHKLDLLSSVLEQEGVQQAIVFTATQSSTEDLADYLQERGLSAEALHGGMHQRARNRVIKMMHQGQIEILVATDVAARGVDVSTISHVINFDLPMEPENYVHRIGRTARAGRTGTSVTLVSLQDRRRLQLIEKLLGMSISVAEIPGLEPKLHKADRPRTQNHRRFQRTFGRGQQRRSGRSF
jgi:superfamily II DNA/RNA helicase